MSLPRCDHVLEVVVVVVRRGPCLRRVTAACCGTRELQLRVVRECASHEDLPSAPLRTPMASMTIKYTVRKSTNDLIKQSRHMRVWKIKLDFNTAVLPNSFRMCVFIY